MSERIQNNSAKLVKIKHIIFNKNRMGIGTVTFFCTWASAGRRHTTNRYKKVAMHNLNVLEVFSVYWFISTFGRKKTTLIHSIHIISIEWAIEITATVCVGLDLLWLVAHFYYFHCYLYAIDAILRRKNQT